MTVTVFDCDLWPGGESLQPGGHFVFECMEDKIDLNVDLMCV